MTRSESLRSLPRVAILRGVPLQDRLRQLLIALLLPQLGCLLPPSRMSSGAASGAGGPSAHNLLANGAFDGGISLPWSTSFTVPGAGTATIQDGAFCVEVTNAGKNRWDAQFRHREMVIQRGHHYAVRFRAWSDKPTSVRPKLGMAGPPYAEYWADTVQLSETPRAFSAEFTMSQPDDPTAELAFHAGAELAASAPFRICIDDVVLEDPQFTRKVTGRAEPVPDVLVNQLGYLPLSSKRATVKSGASDPLAWQLLDASGASVAKGETRPFGPDAASGERVHALDFSGFKGSGSGYKLQVGALQSRAFDVRPDLYAQLRADSLAFFYHQRSGVEIALPYARDRRWVRPAGHLHDSRVPCASGSGCDYSLDVSGGWYDAGDHGKYVVNAGITVWTLLNLYERAAQVSQLEPLGDGKLNIPESGNKLPDLLDEVRWELDWLLKMQVPAGKPLAGMAHHKLHDKGWTEIGVAPHEDKQPRVLMAPSTAATLNLAAVAAQAARVYAPFDQAFSGRCLSAAKVAYDAALAHPDVYAPEANKIGGGAYDDRDVRDEFAWAAAELFSSSGEDRYRAQLEKSPFYLQVPTRLGGEASDAGQATVLTWQNVQAAGTLSLALAARSGELRKRARAAVQRAADELLALREREGFGLPFAPGANNSYPWGSNSFALNNAIVLALAFDFSRDAKYLPGVVSTLDYLLGENPLDQSYISGYGARPLKNPHHRFFSHQVREDRPEVPPGFVSGGPNSGLQDPIAQGAGLAGCAPQKCFLDHIESYSTNEVAINWNAPLAWLAAFLDGAAHTGKP
jgi:endoglucanase